MKTKRFIIPLTIFMSLLCLWACSDDDDNNSTPSEVDNANFIATSAPPNWQVDWTWNDPVPDWQNPDPALYESQMYVVLRLDDRYLPYSSDDDRIALFKNDECRGVAKRSVNGFDSSVRFFIMVWGDNSQMEQRMTIKYYCAKLNHIFTIPGFHGFDPDVVVGDTWDIFVLFGEGSSKYCVYRDLPVVIPDDAPFTPSPNDLIGAFVGEECRGLSHPGELLDVCGLIDVDETFYLRYYSSERAGVYTVTKELPLNYSVKEITLSF